MAVPGEEKVYPRGFEKFNKGLLSQAEHDNIFSFINTQIEEVRENANLPGLVSSHFLQLLKIEKVTVTFCVMKASQTVSNLKVR